MIFGLLTLILTSATYSEGLNCLKKHDNRSFLERYSRSHIFYSGDRDDPILTPPSIHLLRDERRCPDELKPKGDGNDPHILKIFKTAEGIKKVFLKDNKYWEVSFPNMLETSQVSMKLDYAKYSPADYTTYSTEKLYGNFLKFFYINIKFGSETETIAVYADLFRCVEKRGHEGDTISDILQGNDKKHLRDINSKYHQQRIQHLQSKIKTIVAQEISKEEYEAIHLEDMIKMKIMDLKTCSDAISVTLGQCERKFRKVDDFLQACGRMIKNNKTLNSSTYKNLQRDFNRVRKQLFPHENINTPYGNTVY